MPNIELILARSLAAHLSVPAFLADEHGKFVFFNEAAEMVTGRSADETVDFGSEELLAMLEPRHEDGRAVTADEFPLPRALVEGVPSHLHAISGNDGGKRYVATAVPLADHDGLTFGAIMFLFEDKR